MPLNPGNFLFPIQNLGPDFGKFFGAYNEQQKRGEEREKALAENAMSKINLEYAPREKEANIKGLESDALYKTLLARYYPDLARVQIQEHGAHGNLYSQQAKNAAAELQIKQDAIDAIQRYNNSRNSGGQAGGISGGPGTSSPMPMEGGIPWKQGVEESGSPQSIAERYPSRKSGVNDLYEAAKADPSLAYALEVAGHKFPESVIKADITRSENTEKAYNESVASASASGDMLENLNQVQELVDLLPDEVRSAVGPVNHLMAKYRGDPEVQATLGAIMSKSRDLQADYARRLSERVTDKDLNLDRKSVV